MLKEAQRMGIGRFDANLIIALVQHRRAAGRNPRPINDKPRSAGSSWIPALCAAALLQTLLLTTAWLLFA